MPFQNDRRPERTRIASVAVGAALMSLVLTGCTLAAERAAPSSAVSDQVDPDAVAGPTVPPTAQPARTAGTGDRPTGAATEAAEAGPTVRLDAGDDFDTVVQSHPPGTTYVIAAGVHRDQFVTPDEGDVFVGEDGAVLSGTEVVAPEAFVRDADVWVSGDRDEEPFRIGGELHGSMIDGFARDAANHDLWWDDQRLRHVERRDDVDAPGEWFFDYAANEVVVFDDPATAQQIELAVGMDFIRARTADVTVRNLTFERWASPAQNGVVHADGPGWHIVDVVVRESHGTGIVLNDGAVLEGSSVVDNGQLGVGAADAADVVVRDTEIARNGTLGYRWEWERGGLKFKTTQDAVITGNHVHGNHGPGIWFDIDNVGATIEGNLVEDNDVNGIFYEISSDGVIADNRVFGNGLAEDVGTLGSGIFISISHDVLVQGNTTAGNHFEIIGVHATRPEALHRGYETSNLRVVDNDVTVSRDGGVGLWVDTGQDEYYSERGNVFEDNRYTLEGCADCFRWGPTIDFAAWQAVGNDLDGVVEGGGEGS